MAFAKQMIELKQRLELAGHRVFVSDFIRDFLGVSEEEKERKNRRNVIQKDAIREFWKKIKKSDAILVLNYDRHGISHYIGGNTLMEIGFAHVLEKRIYLLHAIPDIRFYRAEIEGIKPVILDGDLSKIR